MLAHLPVLLYRVKFRAVRWKIVQAQRFAALAAKSLDGFASVPRRVIDEKNKTHILLKQHANKTYENFLCLSCDKSENKCALCSRSNDMKAFSGVVCIHDWSAAF